MTTPLKCLHLISKANVYATDDRISDLHTDHRHGLPADQLSELLAIPKLFTIPEFLTIPKLFTIPKFLTIPKLLAVSEFLYKLIQHLFRYWGGGRRRSKHTRAASIQ